MVDFAAQAADEYYERLNETSQYWLWISTLFKSILTSASAGLPYESTDPIYWHFEIPQEKLDYAPAFPSTPVTYEYPSLYSPSYEILSEAGT